MKALQQKNIFKMLSQLLTMNATSKEIENFILSLDTNDLDVIQINLDNLLSSLECLVKFDNK